LEDLGTTLTKQNSIHEKNLEQTEVRECLLSFGAKSFVFRLEIKKF
jgi:hypothetical protein